MKKTDLILGFIIGIITALVGTFLFLISFTDYSINDIQLIKQQGILGKVITIGAILNLIIFFILLQKKEELMARGVILSMIILTIITLFL